MVGARKSILSVAAVAIVVLGVAAVTLGPVLLRSPRAAIATTVAFLALAIWSLRWRIEYENYDTPTKEYQNDR